MTNLSKFLIIIAVATSSLVFHSCMSSDSSTSVEISNNCAITRMTLGTLTRTVYGADTSYNISVAGNAYPMYIDQINQKIYNRDSLPINTDIRKILFSSVSNDGTLTYKNDNDRDTLFSTSDTIDFTSPRYFTCFSTDQTQSRTYEVKINVHNSDPNKFSWATTSETPLAFENITLQKMFILNGNVTIVAIKQGIPTLIEAPLSTPNNVTTSPINNLDNLNPSAVFLFKNQLCYVDNGTLKTSDNGTNWQVQTTDITPTCIVATTETELYAIANGELYYTSNLTNWQKDTAADNLNQFPTSDIVSTMSPMTFNTNFQYLLVCGKNNDGENIVWRKIIDTKGINTEPWTILPPSDEGRHLYPSKEQPVLLTYNSNGLLHLGIKGNNISEIIKSVDGGRCWTAISTDNTPVLPAETTSFSACVDSDNNIWIAIAPSGKMLRGRLNQLSYDNDPTVFPQ